MRMETTASMAVMEVMAIVRTAGWREGGLVKLDVRLGGGNIAGMSFMVNVGGCGCAIVVVVVVFCAWIGLAVFDVRELECVVRISMLSTVGCQWTHVARRIVNSCCGEDLMV